MSANKTEKLNALLTQQQSIIEALRREADALGNEDLAVQNEALNKALTETNTKLHTLENDNEALQKQLTTAKEALFAKMADEKLAAFLHTQKRIDALYYKQADTLDSRLDAYEKQCATEINKTIAQIDGVGSEQFADLRERLEQIKTELSRRREELRTYSADRLQATKDAAAGNGEALKNEPLQEIEKKGALKHKSFESFVGLNLLSKAGILLFLVGIVMLGRFTYMHLSDVFKAGMIYLLGAVLIVAGELFARKEKTIFSTALVSGGVAVLFAATATAYFAFGRFSVYIAFIVCIALTAHAMFLSHQVNSQIVCAFGTVGGYLPVIAPYMISFGKAASDAGFLPVSCLYFTLLSLIVFIMSRNKNWHIARFTGFALQTIAVGGVGACAWALRDLRGGFLTLMLAAFFAIVSFVIYLLFPARLIRKNKPLDIFDLVLLTLDTVVGAVSISCTVRNCFSPQTGEAGVAVGAVFLILTVLYAALTFSARKMQAKERTAATSISAGFTMIFSMLIVPLMFGADYAPVAWAIEGCAVAYYGIAHKSKPAEFAGLAAMTLSAVAYLSTTAFFSAADKKAISVISFIIIVCAFWIYAVRGLVKKDGNALYIILEILTAAASVVLLSRIYSLIIESRFFTLTSKYTDSAMLLVFILPLAAALRFGLLRNKASLIASDIAGAALVVLALTLNISKYNAVYNFYYEPAKGTWLSVFNLLLLLCVNVAVLFFFSVSVAHFIGVTKAPAWFYTAAMAVISPVLITVTLTRQFDLRFSNVLISAVYIAAACVMLLIGFRKNYTVVRTGGLVLILASFAKLCFVDTTGLDTGWKIGSYFAFGAILILISFFYQRFSKKLEKNAEAMLKPVNKTQEEENA